MISPRPKITNFLTVFRPALPPIGPDGPVRSPLIPPLAARMGPLVTTETPDEHHWVVTESSLPLKTTTETPQSPTTTTTAAPTTTPTTTSKTTTVCPFPYCFIIISFLLPLIPIRGDIDIVWCVRWCNECAFRRRRFLRSWSVMRVASSKWFCSSCNKRILRTIRERVSRIWKHFE